MPFWYMAIPTCLVIYFVVDLILIGIFKKLGYYEN